MANRSKKASSPPAKRPGGGRPGSRAVPTSNPPVVFVLVAIVVAFIGGAIAVLAMDLSAVSNPLLQQGATFHWTTRVATLAPPAVWGLLMFWAAVGFGFVWMANKRKHRRAIVWASAAVAVGVAAIVGVGTLTADKLDDSRVDSPFDQKLLDGSPIPRGQERESGTTVEGGGGAGER